MAGNPRASVVTAASSNHFASMCHLCESVLASGLEDVLVVAYDLGLSCVERLAFEAAFPAIPLRRFDYSAHPPYYDIAVACGQWAWKPAIVREVYEGLGGGIPVIWADAGDVIHDLPALLATVEENGIHTALSCGDVRDWTHPGTLLAMGALGTPVEGMKMRNAALVGFGACPFARELLAEWDRACATEGVIAPPGSHRENHRQDQSVLSILFYRYMDAHGFRDVTGYVGYSIQQDRPDLPETVLRALA